MVDWNKFKIFTKKEDSLSIVDENLLAVVRKNKMFSNINDYQLKQLIEVSERISLSKNDILFKRGDISNNMYIVLKGQLLAFLLAANKVKLVGTIQEGEIVGELGAFSNKTRSLTVKAATECILMSLSRDSLLEFWNKKSNVAYQMQMIDSLALRSQSTIRLLANEKLYRHVALIPAIDEVVPPCFMASLKKNILNSHNVLLIDEDYFTQQNLKSTIENIKKILIEADKDNHILIFNLSVSDDIHNFIVQYIDALYIIASRTTRPIMDQSIKEILDDPNLSYISRKVLVLCYPNDDIIQRKNTQSWLDLANFTMHHHVRQNRDNDFKSLIRFIIDRPHGLVISGGGSRCWAALGAIRALEDCNISIDAIGGTSGGSMIAASYALYQSIKKATTMLEPLINKKLTPFALKNLTYPLVSLTNARHFTDILRKIFENWRAEDLWVPFFSMCCNFNAAAEVRDTKGLVWENLRASCSLPLIYPPMVKEGSMYVDGGLLNNFPVDQMRDLIGEKSFIIGIYTSPWEVNETKYNFPMTMPFIDSLLTRLGIRNADYVYPPFVESFLNALLLGSSAKSAANAQASDLLIEFDLHEYSRLGLTKDKVDALIQIGYQSARAAIANLPKEQLKLLTDS